MNKLSRKYLVFVSLVVVVSIFCARSDASDTIGGVDADVKSLVSSLLISAGAANGIEGKTEDEAIRFFESALKSDQVKGDKFRSLVTQKYIEIIRQQGVKGALGVMNRQILSTLNKLEARYDSINDPKLKKDVARLLGKT